MFDQAAVIRNRAELNKLYLEMNNAHRHTYLYVSTINVSAWIELQRAMVMQDYLLAALIDNMQDYYAYVAR